MVIWYGWTYIVSLHYNPDRYQLRLDFSSSQLKYRKKLLFFQDNFVPLCTSPQQILILTLRTLRYLPSAENRGVQKIGVKL